MFIRLLLLAALGYMIYLIWFNWHKSKIQNSNKEILESPVVQIQYNFEETIEEVDGTIDEGNLSENVDPVPEGMKTCSECKIHSPMHVKFCAYCGNSFELT